MKKNYSKLKQAVFLAALFIGGTCGIKAQLTVVNFSYTGSMVTWTVPQCVGTVTVNLRGASGGTGAVYNNAGGLGGRVTGVFTVTAGQLLYFNLGGQGGVGSGGYNGGGVGATTYGGYGGGGSDIRTGGNALANRIMVAGGGGGGGVNCGDATNPGGHGGGTTGQDGYQCNAQNSYQGTGGTQSAGGISNGGLGTSGSAGQGGQGQLSNYGGGGGGGYYGGGGGSYGGGGGGSNYAATWFTSVAHTQGNNLGNGALTVSYTPNGLPMTAVASPTSICVGGSATLSAQGGVTYTWSTGSNNSSVVVSPASNTQYTVQGTNAFGCNIITTLNLTVSPGLPVLSVTTSTNNLCLGKTATLTASGAITYTWSGGVQNGLAYSPTVTQSYTVTGENGCGTTTAVTTITVAPLAITAISSSSLVCSGSQATLTAAGPATGFTWTPFPAVLTGTQIVLNPTVTTIFTVTASDGTCAGTATVQVASNPVPVIGVSANNTIVCEGYPVNLTASGGLSYTWTPGNLSGNAVTVNPALPTLYVVVGSNSLGCTSQTTQIVLTNPSPTLTIAANNTFVCPGSAVDIVATGGNTYVWSNGPITSSIIVNPTQTTTYSVTGSAQNNTCTATKAITIMVFTPSVTTTPAATVCNGSNVTINANGADTYLWDNGSFANLLVVSPTVNTTYTVTASTNSNNLTCSVVKTIPVTVNPKPNIIAAGTNTNICRNESTVLNATGALTFTWTTPQGGSTVSNSISVTPTVPVLYNYSVTGADANGCVNTTVVQVNVKACLGLNESVSSLNQLFIYPNPSTGEFTIEAASEISLIILNELGQSVGTLNLTNLNSNKVSVKDLANGIYFVKGQNDNSNIHQKIIVNK